MDEPPKRPPMPYRHVRSGEGSLLGEAIAITGNAKALLKLRAQIVAGTRHLPVAHGTLSGEMGHRA